MQKSAVIISGGVAHPYEATSQIAAEYLSEAGFSCVITEDADTSGFDLTNGDIVVLNCVKFTCTHTPEWRSEWEHFLSQKAKTGLKHLTERGVGIVALHCAPICFDDFPEFYDIIGTEWRWGTSGHGPYAQYKISLTDVTHPLTAGVTDFTIYDELYINLVPHEKIIPLITAEYEGQSHPVLWTKTYENSRVCYFALGHDEASFRNPSFKQVFLNCAQWSSKKQDKQTPPIKR